MPGTCARRDASDADMASCGRDGIVKSHPDPRAIKPHAVQIYVYSVCIQGSRRSIAYIYDPLRVQICQPSDVGTVQAWPRLYETNHGPTVAIDLILRAVHERRPEYSR